MENNIEYITLITYLFFIYLILAIFIERVVEVCVSIFNYFDMKRNWYRIWNKKARSYQKRFDRIYGYQGGHTPQIDRMLNWVLWKALSERPYTGGKEIISAALIRLNYLRISMRLFAFLIALAFTIIIKVELGFDLVDTVKKLLPGSKVLSLLSGQEVLKVFLTAVAISLGSEPLHQLISRFEKMCERKYAPAQGGSNESA
jgi:hypothetical protein